MFNNDFQNNSEGQQVLFSPASAEYSSENKKWQCVFEQVWVTFQLLLGKSETCTLDIAQTKKQRKNISLSLYVFLFHRKKKKTKKKRETN